MTPWLWAAYIAITTSTTVLMLSIGWAWWQAAGWWSVWFLFGRGLAELERRRRP